MSIRRRIWSLPVVALVVFAVGIAFSYFFTQQTSNSLISAGRTDYPFLHKSQLLVGALQDTQEQLRNAVTEGDESGLSGSQRYAEAFSKTVQEIAALPGKGALAAQIKQEFDAYYAAAYLASKNLLSATAVDPGDSVAQMQQAQQVLERTLETTRVSAQRDFDRSLQHGEANARRALAANVLSAIMVTAALFLIAHLVVRSIWRELGGEPEQAAQIMRGVAAGDLTAKVTVALGAEESLLASVSRMQTALGKLMGDISDLASRVSHSSSEISAGNTDLSQRTDEQATSLEETAATMEQLTGAVNQNRLHAKHAESLAQNNTAQAQEGAQAMRAVVETMVAIKQNSKQIVEIIGVIEGIAFQTNILALNAAVEAARAGDQGRGFGVVASEVRSLSRRSEQAAKEIRTLIQNSVAKVEQGGTLSERAGAAVQVIVESAQDVKSVITEIASASAQQASGIEQVNQTIAQLEGVTQRNASLVQELAGSADALNRQAEELERALGVFKINAVVQPANDSAQGQLATPVDMKSNAVREEFLAKILGKNSGQVKVTWSRIVFSGKGQPRANCPTPP